MKTLPFNYEAPQVMIRTVDFKFKSKFGVMRDTTSLERVLKMYYPGAKTLDEALLIAKQQMRDEPAQSAPVEHAPSSSEWHTPHDETKYAQIDEDEPPPF